jgi:hypothetical protein
MVRFRAVIQGTTDKIHKTTPFTTRKVDNVKYTHHRCYVKVIISCARLQDMNFPTHTSCLHKLFCLGWKRRNGFPRRGHPRTLDRSAGEVLRR